MLFLLCICIRLCVRRNAFKFISIEKGGFDHLKKFKFNYNIRKMLKFSFLNEHVIFRYKSNTIKQ